MEQQSVPTLVRYIPKYLARPTPSGKALISRLVDWSNRLNACLSGIPSSKLIDHIEESAVSEESSEDEETGNSETLSLLQPSLFLEHRSNRNSGSVWHHLPLIYTTRRLPHQQQVNPSTPTCLQQNFSLGQRLWSGQQWPPSKQISPDPRACYAAL